MSAPNTNLERQKRRHAGPILGIIAVLVFALGLFLAYTTVLVDEGQPPAQTPDQAVPQTQGTPETQGTTGLTAPAGG